MKIHIGKHILNGDCEGRAPCGFCGRSCCENKLGKPNRKGNSFFYSKVQSNCPFFIHTTRRIQNSSKKNPCTNYLNKCSQCQADIWHYNTKNHYEDMHPGCTDIPDVDPQEIANMKNESMKKASRKR